MENATKALLIAAAILIAIVLVSIGVFVLRQGQDAMSAADMSEAQILAFNANFKTYEGIQRGSQVKALLQRISNSNNKGDASTAIKVTITGVSDVSLSASKDASAIKNAAGKISTAAYYKVEFDENNNTQLIEKANITAQ